MERVGGVIGTVLAVTTGSEVLVAIIVETVVNTVEISDRGNEYRGCDDEIEGNDGVSHIKLFNR